jgi:hypothetical protein
MSFARPVLKRLLREARSESGLSLIELLIVMLLMGMLLGTITTILVSGIGTQSGLTATFGAETNLHTGLGKLRTDVNLACSESAQSATSVTLVDPPCDGTKNVTWCTQGSGSVYGLYRITSGSTCTGGVKYADYLTGGSIFTYTAQNSPTGSYALPRLHVDVTVNPTPTLARNNYRVVDDLVFRNGVRQ